MLIVLILMLLCHIIDDFVLQPVCLSNLKQKSWWEKNAPDDLYKDDYICALIIHALSWSIMIMLPVILLTSVEVNVIGILILINTAIHAYVDDLKANKKSISLILDQVYHLLQIVVSYAIINSFC